MSEVVLSRLQFVVVGLVQASPLFTQEDLAHLSSCEVKLANTTRGESALIADIDVYFKDWSFIEHKASSNEADRMPAVVRIVLFQNQDRKLTGKVELGFFADDPVLNTQLDYLRGW
jgi:hypothetical protein